MAKVLVLYESNNRGYTADMAALVAEGAKSLEGVDVRVRSVEDAGEDDICWADGIALGSPTNLGGISWRMKEWWDTRSFDLWGALDGKLGCAFSSSGAWGGGGEQTCMALNTLMMNFGMLVFGVTDYVAPKMAPHYGAICAGSPRTEAEQEMCRRLGRRLAEWCAVYVDGVAAAHPSQASYDRAVQHG
ncbi:flavodoxin family protein [Pseudaestuariivita sp.]|uniref:flavodoxin family protein n=1 Tax=Pseudaestuariivita sp. TaxID=2211669 RepID=UPI004059170C